MKLTRANVVLAVIAVLVVAAIAVQAIWRPFSHGKKLVIQPHEVVFDIRYPDATIDSVALSRLPRDIIRVPLLKTLLTQDFVDYYESNSFRLSVEGTLRRFAFEHDLDWRDEIIKRMFDEPSRVLLWRSPDGRLGYWVTVMHRNGLSRLVQAVGNLAASDSQLSKIKATLPGDVPVYALKLAIGHTVLFAVKGDQIIIMSEPGILLDSGGDAIGERAAALAKMLDDGGDDAMRAWYLDNVSGKDNEHRLIVSANYLSFGYQDFFSGINALRFDFSASGDGAWSTAALIAPAKLPQQHWDSADLWRALPANAAACVSLPVNWDDAADLLDELGDSKGDNKQKNDTQKKTDTQKAGNGEQQAANSEQAVASALRDQFAAPAAVCWYQKSTLLAPVFITRLKPEAVQNPAQLAQLKTALAGAFGDIIGSYEEKADSHDRYRRLPVQASETKDGATRWMRPVSALSGTAQSDESPYADQLSSPNYFPVTLALAQGYVVFSPDASLVDNTLAVLDKRYPAIADTLPPQRLSTSVALVTPADAAALIEREAGRTLPADREATFRDAARTHLFPKLRAVAKYPPFSLSLPDSLPASSGWVPVEWHAEQRAKGN